MAKELLPGPNGLLRFNRKHSSHTWKITAQCSANVISHKPPFSEIFSIEDTIPNSLEFAFLINGKHQDSYKVVKLVLVAISWSI